MVDKQVILQRITKLVDEKKLDQKDLCEGIGLKSSQAYTNWKNGDNTSYMKYLPEIAEYLGVSLDFLVGRSDTRSVQESHGEDFLVFNRNGETIRVELTDQVQSELVDTFLKALLKKNEPEI